jgi:polyhydroxyalkanoate synthesis regulator phasin
MNESRRKILDMLAQGQINPDEAERLINALDKEAAPASGSASEAPPKPKPKYLRVMVEEQQDLSLHEPSVVNVRIPLQLLRAGVKLASIIPAQARDHVNGALRDNGLGIDIGQIRPENLEEIIDQLDDVVIDVDKKSEKVKVRIFCE